MQAWNGIAESRLAIARLARGLDWVIDEQLFPTGQSRRKCRILYSTSPVNTES